MNDKSVLKKYTATKPSVTEAAHAPEGEMFDDLGSFGWLRGVRDRAVMLEIRHKDGRVSAFGYAWLDQAIFDPSDGITLHFLGKTVRLIGRNLNSENQPNVRLFAGITRHRVPWVVEADGPTTMDSPRGATIVEEVEIT